MTSSLTAESFSELLLTLSYKFLRHYPGPVLTGPNGPEMPLITWSFGKALFTIVFIYITSTIIQITIDVTFIVIPCEISTLRKILNAVKYWVLLTVESPPGEPIEVSEPPDPPDDVVVKTPDLHWSRVESRRDRSFHSWQVPMDDFRRLRQREILWRSVTQDYFK